MSANLITIRFEKLCQQETGWFGGDRFGMLAPMAQRDVPAAAIPANTVLFEMFLKNKR
jgi:hypothetical protein